MSSLFAGVDTLTGILAITTAAGGFVTGRRATNKEAMAVASETVDLLQAQVEALRDDKADRDVELISLRSRVEVLESLITQRAEVEAVHRDVKANRVVLDKIAIKVGVEQ
jgi:hypothetical protein